MGVLLLLALLLMRRKRITCLLTSSFLINYSEEHDQAPASSRICLNRKQIFKMLLSTNLLHTSIYVLFSSISESLSAALYSLYLSTLPLTTLSTATQLWIWWAWHSFRNASRGFWSWLWCWWNWLKSRKRGWQFRWTQCYGRRRSWAGTGLTWCWIVRRRWSCRSDVCRRDYSSTSRRSSETSCIWTFWNDTESTRNKSRWLAEMTERRRRERKLPMGRREMRSNTYM